MKPIIVSTEDVRAVMDGRKTMARMPIKPQLTYWDDGERLYDKDNIVGPEFYSPIRVDKDGEEYPGKEVYGIYSNNGEYGCESPYKPGDVLWVRETWAKLNEKEYLYQADDTDVNVWKIWRDKGVGAVYDRWMSPVTMPREAARLFLRVTDVRVERVQDITEKDAIREGIMYTDYGMNSDMGKLSVDGGKTFHELKPLHYPGYHAGGATNPDQCFCTARRAFADLWDARNAKRGYGWDSNPLVWVIEFERTQSGAIGPEPDGTAPNGDKGAES